jgi:sulfatase maturation enzyme AslB (radical SAM superfamily)
MDLRMDLSILYRGPLSSCNYGCEYCPFAKREESYAQLETDRVALLRFVAWR